MFWICFILGIGIFLYLLCYFIAVGYFGGDFGILHVFQPSIRADFPLIIYSLLFSYICVLFIKKQKCFTLLCQFVLIGLVIDIFWKKIESRITGMDYYFTLDNYNLLHLILIVGCIVLLILNRQSKKYCTIPIKRLIIMTGINLALIGGKYLVPKYGAYQSYMKCLQSYSVKQRDVFTIPEDSLKYAFVGDISMFIENQHTLLILSDGKLTYHPFGQFQDVEHFWSKYSTFQEEKQFIETDTVYNFFYKESFVKIYFNKDTEDVSGRIYEDELNIVSGRIVNTEIQLIENVHVGMSKNDLLQKFFSNKTLSMYDFNNVDTLINSTSDGDIEQSYIFVNDTLKEIIMKSSYDWIPFDL